MRGSIFLEDLPQQHGAADILRYSPLSNCREGSNKQGVGSLNDIGNLGGGNKLK